MSHLRFFSALILWSAVAGTWFQAVAQADSSPGAGASAIHKHLGKSLPQRTTSADEHFAMPQFPLGWERHVAQSGPIEIFEYFPKSQNTANWRDKITLEVHHDTNTLPLDAYQRRALGMMRENCEGIFEGSLQTGMNNGFPAAYWTMGCKRDTRGNFGETRYTKAIQGSVTLYLLSRTWRTPAYGDKGPPLSPGDMETARQFLGSSVVCVANGTQHPCPASGLSNAP